MGECAYVIQEHRVIGYMGFEYLQTCVSAGGPRASSAFDTER